jgi:hypothetical protein
MDGGAAPSPVTMFVGLNIVTCVMTETAPVLAPL